MFDDVLNQALGDLVGNDLGRVGIQHETLHDPIAVPLQPLDKLNADKGIQTIEKVLYSNRNLAVDESLDITVRRVDLAKGGFRGSIAKIKGDYNSLDLKTSIVTIQNEDKLYMARAIGIRWAKLKQCTQDELSEITKTRQMESNLD